MTILNSLVNIPKVEENVICRFLDKEALLSSRSVSAKLYQYSTSHMAKDSIICRILVAPFLSKIATDTEAARMNFYNLVGIFDSKIKFKNASHRISNLEDSSIKLFIDFVYLAI